MLIERMKPLALISSFPAYDAFFLHTPHVSITIFMKKPPKNIDMDLQVRCVRVSYRIEFCKSQIYAMIDLLPIVLKKAIISLNIYLLANSFVWKCRHIFI